MVLRSHGKAGHWCTCGPQFRTCDFQAVLRICTGFCS